MSRRFTTCGYPALYFCRFSLQIPARALSILIEVSFLSPFKRISGAVYSSDTFSLSYLFDAIFVS